MDEGDEEGLREGEDELDKGGVGRRGRREGGGELRAFDLVLVPLPTSRQEEEMMMRSP